MESIINIFCISLQAEPSSPNLKLLHSSSLKKACMYISEKAVNQTSTSLDSEAFSEDFGDQALPGKIKLRASQSLPIMRKYWKRDLTSEDSIKGLIKSLQKINSIKSFEGMDKDFGEPKSLNEFLNTCQNVDCAIPVPEDDKEANPVQQNEGEPVGTISEIAKPVKENDTRFSFGILDLNDYEKCAKLPGTLAGISAKKESNIAECQVPETPSGLSQRGSLTRQTTIFCQKSSADSSSVKTDHSSDDKKSSDLQSSSSNTSGQFRAFRSIYVHSDAENNTENKNEVTIVIPKAKIDKFTQVSHSEITKETGWDLLEGVYLLLRKISIKIPSESNVTSPANKLVSKPVEGMDRIHPRVNMTKDDTEPDCNRLQVPLSPRDDRDYPRRPYLSLNNKRVSSDLELHGQLEQLNNENFRNVNAWFERNNLLNSPNRLAPVRQYTMETVDSGFDDSQIPANFNRHGRFSLPNVLSGK
jgi:hypothetical protein